jgi:hypothetical protein
VEQAIAAAQAAAEKNAPTRAEPSATRKRNINRGALPLHLPREEIVIDVEDKTCACCGGRRVPRSAFSSATCLRHQCPRADRQKRAPPKRGRITGQFVQVAPQRAFTGRKVRLSRWRRHPASRDYCGRPQAFSSIDPLSSPPAGGDLRGSRCAPVE